jgi:hypothetical protein
MERADDALSKLIPKNPNCPLSQCTAMKVFVVLALISIASSALQSWSSFVGTIFFEAIIGLLVVWLCRNCRTKWAWAVVFLTCIAPILFLIVFLIGIFAVAAGAKK